MAGRESIEKVERVGALPSLLNARVMGLVLPGTWGCPQAPCLPHEGCQELRTYPMGLWCLKKGTLADICCRCRVRGGGGVGTLGPHWVTPVSPQPTLDLSDEGKQCTPALKRGPALYPSDTEKGHCSICDVTGPTLALASWGGK